MKEAQWPTVTRNKDAVLMGKIYVAKTTDEILPTGYFPAWIIIRSCLSCRLSAKTDLTRAMWQVVYWREGQETYGPQPTVA
jgi:hypothetical protein